MHRNKLAIRLGIGFVILISAGLIAAVIITGYIVFNNTSQLSSNEWANAENSMAFLKERDFDYAGFLDTYTVEKIELASSYDGHMIPADLIHTGTRDNDTVILIHGTGGDRVSMLFFAPLFLDHGYNVLTYDQRSAGENFAPYTTLGYLESYDAADYIAYLDEAIGKDKEIHMLGASSGATTAVIALSRGIVEERVSSLILDCPIGNLEDMFRLRMGKMDIGLPMDFLLFSGSLYNRMAIGFFYKDVSPEDCLRNSTLPVLILASKADETAPFFMAEKFHAAASDSILMFLEDSAHCDLIFDNPQWYGEQVFHFLDNQRK